MDREDLKVALCLLSFVLFLGFGMTLSVWLDQKAEQKRLQELKESQEGQLLML